MLFIAIVLTVAIGIAHSYLGEKYILIRLFRQPLPKLFGNDAFTRNTLRFAWHITTIAWFGFAAILLQIYLGYLSRFALLIAVGSTFAISGLVALLASRGKHYSWVVFIAISAICYVSALAT